MLRSEIHDSVDNLISAIKSCEIVEIFSTVLDTEGETNTEAALNSYSRFLKIAQTYTPFENQLLEMFGLEKLTDANFWARILKRNDPQLVDTIKEMHTSTQFLLDHLPKILALTGQDMNKVASAIEEGKKGGFDYALFAVVVAEEEELSSPQRLILLFDSVKGLYEVVARIKNLPVLSLSVARCDSGVDKNFDFLGLSEIIDEVRKIILSVWDGIVYYREDKTGRHLDLITKSLQVLEEINKLEQAGTFEKEEAEILRRLAISSVKKFAQAGVTISEMEDVTRFDPRELMRPDRKLLVAPREAEPPAAPESGMVVTEDEDDEDDFPEPEHYERQTTADESDENQTAVEEEAVVDSDVADDADQFINPGSESEPEPESAPISEPGPEPEPEAKGEAEADPFASAFAETVADVITEADPSMESAPEEEEVLEPARAAEPETNPESVIEAEDKAEFIAPRGDTTEPASEADHDAGVGAEAGEEPVVESEASSKATDDIPEIDIDSAPPLEELIKSEAFAASLEDDAPEEIAKADPFGVADDEDNIPEVVIDVDSADVPESEAKTAEAEASETETAPEAVPDRKAEAAKEADASMDNYFERIAAGYLKMKQEQEKKKDKNSLE